MSKLKNVARELEKHISILVDYDVIDYHVGDTLIEHVQRIIEQYNDEEQPTNNVRKKIGKKNLTLGENPKEDNWAL